MKKLIVIFLISILNLCTIRAYDSPITIIDLEKNADIEYYCKIFADNEYSVYGPSASSFNKAAKTVGFSTQYYNVDMEASQKTNQAFEITITGCIAKEDFVGLLLDFYIDLTTKFGQPDSAYYWPEGGIKRGERFEYFPVNEIGNDTTTIKQFIEKSKPFVLEWRRGRYQVNLDVTEKFDIYYKPDFRCHILDCELQEAYFDEKKAFEEDIKNRETQEKVFKIILIFIGVLLALFLAKVFIKEYKKMKDKEKEYKKVKEEERLKKQSTVNNEHERLIKELTDKYGTITRTISNARYDDESIMRYNDIFVMEQPKRIYFDKKGYNFSDILSCSIYDENQNDVPVVQITRTNTGSMLGRAAVGGLTLGVAGAVVGALTAKQESISSTNDTPHVASYIVKIGVKSIENPTIILKYYRDKETAETVYAIIQAIIAMK